jgi:hypothetical protein
LKLTRVSAHWFHLRVECEYKLDVRSDRSVQELFNVADQCVDIQNLRLQNLPSAHRQKLTRQGRSARGRFPDLMQIRSARVGFFEGEQDELRETTDGRDQIVEVVRDASSESADSLHLLRLAQLLFQLFAAGHVACHAQYRRLCIATGDRGVEGH